MIVVLLLAVIDAGELVWREREAGLNEITDAAPVPKWVLFLSKFLGLGLVLVAWLARAPRAKRNPMRQHRGVRSRIRSQTA